MTWTPWQKLEHDAEPPRPRNPYIDWSLNGSGEERFISEDKEIGQDGGLIFQQFTPPEFGVGDPDWFVFPYLDEIAIPPKATNPLFQTDPISIAPPEEARLPGEPTEGEVETLLEDDTIIAGIIDVGIPLGHRRLRFPNGQTRLLAAWQMIGDWFLNDDTGRADLPFGCEFYEAGINALLTTHSGGDMTAWLDEAAFNGATGTLNYERATRQTTLGQRASHGAHVADMVAGLDPADHAHHAFGERVRIIAVNAPSSAVFGASGTYLDAYMLNAVQRIVDTSDALWRKNHNGQDPAEGQGYKVVINMSFGKQAGSKDTIDRFASGLAEMQAFRSNNKLPPVYIVMPVGNDNMDRCCAYLEPRAQAEAELNLRVLPQDQSSNFTEFWTRDVTEPDAQWPPAPVSPAVEIWARSPAGHESAPDDLPAIALGETYLSTLSNAQGNVMAHLYLRRVAEQRSTRCVDEVLEAEEPEATPALKFQHILCLAPTYRLDHEPEAPAGVWQLKVKNLHTARLQTVLSVQTDQGLTPNRSINLRSYFDDPGYVTHGPDGRLLESYAYPVVPFGGDSNLDIDADTPVRRHGTMNSSAAHDAVARVGGYRASDGRPAPYSSTGRGRPSGADDGTILGSTNGKERAYAPTASFPTDDGPGHFGILSAGSIDGSCVAMRGTSFASSQAAREVIRTLLANSAAHTPNRILFDLAKAQEKLAPNYLRGSNAQTEVRGRGRLRSPVERPASRRGDSFYDAYD